MSALAAPFGFRPVYHPSGLIRSRCLPNGIASGLASNIFQNQPVAFIAGTGVLTPVVANNVDFVGVFQGIEFTPLGGRPAVANFWVSGTVYDTTQPVNVYYVDDPETVFEVQADGSVAAATAGQEFNITNFAAGSTSTGLSAATVGAAGVGTGVQGQWYHEGAAPYVDNIYGDAFTIIQVKMARSSFRANKVSI